MASDQLDRLIVSLQEAQAINRDRHETIITQLANLTAQLTQLAQLPNWTAGKCLV